MVESIFAFLYFFRKIRSNAKMLDMSGDLYRCNYFIPAGRPKGTNIFPVKVMDSAGFTASTEITLVIKSIVAVSEGAASPYQIINDIANPVTFIAKAKSLWADVTNVTIDLSPIGGNSAVTMTNVPGTSNYSCIYLVPQGIPGKDHYIFTITATDKSNNIGTTSVLLRVEDKLSPSSPHIIKAVADKEKVELEWEISIDETEIAEYRVFRGTEKSQYSITNFMGNKTTWTDTNIKNGATYYYMVIAIDTSTNKSYSEEIEVVIPELEGLIQARKNYVRINEGDEPYSIMYIEVMEDNSKIKIDIYDILGKHIKTIVDDIFSRRVHIFTWDLDDKHRNKVTTGLYIAVIKINNNKPIRKKIIIIK